ncbi:Asp23/Gls24 family envelope stress response protein [Streptomyces sp. 4503]|uniref:Asp23/Gls24 family envelope stress response protein n=1 Tax=Streptomyces niphimycinicus TaxID=2842201 RepID=A0ABS6CDF6_9ACTN|nr:Asp23/Gls24 family envelope stress response protein [Streptomyces niphimycinicus]MBU3864923.1 Asp23/Gls24 family envelope stress response protein [Streptomyces niphimycinicus]
MVEPGERGATRIADRVVAKIASQAAQEALRVDGTGAAGAGAAAAADVADVVDTADVGPTDAAAAPPHAVAVVRGDVARVRVAVELGYPSDIGAHCGAVRRHVIERVGELTGMEVPEVVVTVERLHMPQWEHPERRVRRGRDRVR